MFFLLCFPMKVCYSLHIPALRKTIADEACVDNVIDFNSLICYLG